jgi:hypothetical protein
MTSSDRTGKARLGLRDLDLKVSYDSADGALRAFYVPALSRSVRYDRSVGFFRSSALAVAAKGMSHFIAGGGTARFLVGAELAEIDRDALMGATEVPPELAERLSNELVPADEIARRRLEVLAWLVREGRLEIRVAVAVDASGLPVPPGAYVPYFHEKIGILWDDREDGVAFHGSINESEQAWLHNFESFSVFRSWGGDGGHFDDLATKFETRWHDMVPGFKVLPLPKAVTDALVALAPDEAPPTKDPEEPEALADRRSLARFLLAAPRLVHSEALAEATSGITAFPHQRKVVERLAAGYPRSWLVADEVGLGKTISAGLALRRLLLRGDVERALVLAPANVCLQWQDELFERFGMWVPRLDGGRIYGAHPDDQDPIPVGVNPYEEHPVLLVSSHLARLPRHRKMIMAAPSLDLLVVDEAHHARRRAADLDQYRPSRLLELLDSITSAGKARATWLLTATPMQIHPIELHDLLRHVGLSGPCSDFTVFERYHAELAKSDDATDWSFLHRTLASTPRLPSNAATRAMFDAISTKIGAIAAERVRRFGERGHDGAELAADLDADGRRELRAWLRFQGPVGQMVTRHSRATLRRYRALGVLHEPIADRDVQAVPVPFGDDEKLLYTELDGLLDRLMELHGSKRGAGFVLTVYRRRLTSSWTAIERTLERRLRNENLALEPELLDEADEAEDLETGEGSSVDDTAVVPLSPADLAEVRRYLDAIRKVGDSKFDRLRDDLENARGSGEAVIVFTQFTDTLESLRDRLHGAYKSDLATFSGEGGRMWSEEHGWTKVPKATLVEALRSGRVAVVLATDAASEGLNLQTASHIINYDLPWNPMRVEQRIGRIDRLGQLSPVVTVRNYVIPGTVEESVYEALAKRIDLFSGLVGQLQPILGATEAAFRTIFRVPRSERSMVESAAIGALVARVDELEGAGLELSDEDPMPEIELPAAPVTLEQLGRCLTEEFDATLDRPGRPTSSDRDRASRDPERWIALATYGHPHFEMALRHAAGPPPVGAGEETGALVIAEESGRAAAFRADRTPPEMVRTLSDLADLAEPVARGEAIRMAEAEVISAEQDHQRYVSLIERAQRARWLGQIVARFRRLVTQAVRAEQVLHRLEEGEVPEPSAVWLALTGDTSTAWCRADDFAAHLGLGLGEVLPRGGPGVDDRTTSVLRRARSEAASSLGQLIAEWLAAEHPEYQQSKA